MYLFVVFFFFFFFKQKTAYEMRISDWSSDVCSSDLPGPVAGTQPYLPIVAGADGAAADDPLRPCRAPQALRVVAGLPVQYAERVLAGQYRQAAALDRKSTRLNSSH